MALAGILRQSTAVDVLVGPFVDSTDGVTPETALTIGEADVRLSKNGQNMVPKNNAVDLVHDEIGYYNCEFNATDTNTVGQLTVAINETGALPVRMDFQVVEETVYDLLYASGATGAVTVNLINTGAITSASIAADAIGASELAADAVSEIVAATVAALQDLDRRGTAQAGDAAAITLAAADQEADDFYNGCLIVLLEGTGTDGVTVAGRTRRITDYVNSTNVATVDEDWVSAPGADTVYLIVGG